jgi:IS30 family transposase
MKHRKRIYYTDKQTAQMWDRWRRGDSITEIASLFDRHHSSVRGIFERAGGVRPRDRRRSARSLTLVDREEIFRGVVAGRSLRSIALRIGRAPSTVSREVKRNLAATATRSLGPMKQPGTARSARRSVNWPGIERWPGWSRAGSSCSGRLRR